MSFCFFTAALGSLWVPQPRLTIERHSLCPPCQGIFDIHNGATLKTHGMLLHRCARRTPTAAPYPNIICGAIKMRRVLGKRLQTPVCRCPLFGRLFPPPSLPLSLAARHTTLFLKKFSSERKGAVNDFNDLETSPCEVHTSTDGYPLCAFRCLRR